MPQATQIGLISAAGDLQGWQTGVKGTGWAAYDVLPGSTHDLTAAREHVLPQAGPYLKELPFLADSGYEGAGAGCTSR